MNNLVLDRVVADAESVDHRQHRLLEQRDVYLHLLVVNPGQSLVLLLKMPNSAKKHIDFEVVLLILQ